MSMPFTSEQFFAVFGEYNIAVWPAQLVLVAIASLAVVFAAVGSRRTSLVPVALLAALWLWSGLVFQIGFFRQINPVASLFGAGFLAQAVLLIVAYRRGSLLLTSNMRPTGLLGWGLIAYSITGYQLSTAIAGHHYPNAPTFGAPCPVALLTLGLLLWNEKATPWYILAIPLLWAAIATVGAIILDASEDYALGLAALTVAIMFVVRHLPSRTAGEPSPPTGADELSL